jgi:small redox-active disulfide protein 2
MKHVKVFGPGCCRCQDTADLVRAEAAKLGIEVEIEKVIDVAEIARAGVISTPGVMIEGRLVHAGGLPKPADVQNWLKGE